MEEGRDNHQETDKSAIITKANSGWGFRKPKLERKRNSKRDLGFIRKHMDLSAETTISHCLHQRGTTPGWSPHQTLRARKDKSNRIEDLICPFRCWEEPSPGSEMHSGRFYVSTAPHPVSVSYVVLSLMLTGWAHRSWRSRSSCGLTCPVDFPPRGREPEQWTLLMSAKHSLAQLPATVLGKTQKAQKGTPALGCHRRGTDYFLLLLLTCLLFQTVMCEIPMQCFRHQRKTILV